MHRLAVRIWLAALLLTGAFAPLSAQAPPPSVSPAKAARPPLIPTADLTADTGFSDLSLSPDGKYIALKATSKDGRIHLAVLDAATREARHNLLLPEKHDLESVQWAGGHRLLVSLSYIGTVMTIEVRYTRLYLYDLDTRAFTMIGLHNTGIDGDNVIYIDPAGEYVLMAMQKDIFTTPAVYRFMLNGNQEALGDIVQKPKSDVWSWFADDKGVVRMGINYSGGDAFKVIYRRDQSTDFKTIAKITQKNVDDAVWDVVRIVSGTDEGFVIKPNDTGQLVLRKFNYATRTPGDIVYAAPGGWDLTNYSLDDNSQPLAVSYTDDRDQIVWFDPKVKAVQARLEKALKGQDVYLMARAKDDSRMLVWASAANDPGEVYVYTPATGHLDMVVAYKNTLQLDQLAQPRPIEYKARDGTVIRGYLTLPLGRDPRKLPLIIHPHGGPYGVRDKLDFDYEVQFLANRGYAVLQPNYRGSSGYGTAFEDLGKGQVGRKMQDDIDDAMDWAVAQGYADPARVCVVGASYGGYAAMWAVIRNPERYRCAASMAGVTDFKSQLKYDDQFFTREARMSFRNRMRGDDDKFDFDLVSPVPQIARLNRPLLVVHGEDDSNVPFTQFTLLRDKAKKAGKPIEVLTFKDEGHGFTKPEDAAKWLDTLGAFLAKNNPAD